MADAPQWQRRFTTPRIDRVAWSPAAPDRLGIVSNEDGSSQAWAWDLDTGERRRASRGGVGAEEVHLSADGAGVVWWLDPTGDERGRWMVTPFEGGEATPLFPVADGWAMGLSIVPGAAAFGLADDETYTVYVQRGEAPPRAVYRHRRPAGVGAEWPTGPGGLSTDATLLAIRHAEESDISRPAVRVLHANTGEALGEVADEGLRVEPAAWSPLPGDQRLVLIRELDDVERPWVWDLSSGALDELSVGLPGAIFLEDWYPDGTALLLRRSFEAQDQLIRSDLLTGVVTELTPLDGTISNARVRPDGEIWLRIERGTHAPRIQDLTGREALSLDGEAAPAGHRFEPVWFENPSGDRIQGWLIRPEGEVPFPTVVSVHGGPEYHDTDAFDPRLQAFVDHGYAVLLVNYRGSTGYGTAYRQLLKGNIGFPESEDIVAGLDHLIATGVTDPDRVAIEGWSWGGYLATLNAGRHPDRWRAVIAGIPVGDYVAAHYECAPALREWDLATLGGSPMELPELYAERNPMTYVDSVRAPMLMIAGDHDSRCPLGQVMVYAHALKARGREVDVHLYPGGHHANDVDEQIAHVELMLSFLGRHLGANPR
jgi:dipeptidyl aminopeptidase/acylaminoacyl peptidase